MPFDASEFDCEVREAASLSAGERAWVLRLFQTNYRDADPAFVDRSLSVLDRVAFARRDGEVVGFALGESRLMDLPRLPEQRVNLAGLCCIAPHFRRRGLFRELTRLATASESVDEQTRRLFCGRVAHPAAMRNMARLASSIPRPGVRPTAWQQQVGQAIADAYGVVEFDPETFVCIGAGRPIGYPRIEFDVEPEEWEAFAAVDRARGDALLAMAWVPDGPPGW